MGASTQSISGNFDAGESYAQSFGALQNKVAYSDPLGLKSIMGQKLDIKSQDHVLVQAFNLGLKTTMSTAGGAGTAGYAMIPVYVDPMVIDTTRKWTPGIEIIPRVTNQGMYADYNIVTAKSGMAFTAVENSSLVVKDSTKDRQSTAIKFLYATGGVTGQSNKAQPSYMLQGFQPTGGTFGGFNNQSAMTSKQMEILLATRAMKELEENLLFNGNSTTSGVAGNPNGTEFDGIITLMSTTNTVAKGTSDLALKDLGTAVRYAFDDGGRPNIGFCSSAMYEDIQNLLLAKFGYLQSNVTTIWGIERITYRSICGPIPIIPSMFMSNVSGSKAIYFLDLSVVEMRVLQDLTYFDLAITRDATDFALKIYETFIIRNTSFCSSVTAVK